MSGTAVALDRNSTGTEEPVSHVQTKNDGSSRQNVGTLERVGSAAVGTYLVVNGVKRKSLGGAALALTGGELIYRGLSGHCPLYGKVGVSTASGKTTGRLEVQQSITINKTEDELYRAWRNPENLSLIMKHFAEITALDEDRAHWAIKTPFGQVMEWNAQIVENRPGELLRWRSIETGGSHEGWVSFRPGPSTWGTEVTLSLGFDSSGANLLGRLLRRSKLVPRMLVLKALQRFKSLMEAGEIPTLQMNPTARTGATANAF